MKAILALVAIFVFNFSATASDQLVDVKQDWTNTGLDFEVLQTLPGFTDIHCKASVANLTNCVIALDYLAKMLPEPQTIQMKSLPKDQGSQFVLEPTEVEVEYFPYNPMGPEAEDIRKYYQNSTPMVQGMDTEIGGTWFDELRKTIFEKAVSIPEESQAWVASKIYNRYLNEHQDPHSAIVPESSYKRKATKKYSGMGAEIHKFNPMVDENQDLKDGVMVKPMPGSPAEAAGLRTGDVILEVDGMDVTTMALDAVVSKIKGLAGTPVDFKVHSVCEQDVVDVTVIRGNINFNPDPLSQSRFVSLESVPQDPVATYCEDNNAEPSPDHAQALYIPVNDFMDQRLCDSFKKQLERDLGNPNSRGIIVDLRNNGGGYLGQVACMLDSLISDDGLIYDTLKVAAGPNGQFVTNESIFDGSFSVHGPMNAKDMKRITGETITAKNKNKLAFTYNRNVVVLVNAGSASASEIFAGTIQDKQRGWVLGVRTFGKGSVQSKNDRFLRPGPSDMVVKKETSALYVLASGRSPQGFGITPDFIGSPDGQSYTTEEMDAARGLDEAGLHNSIQYQPPQPWSQARPEKVATLQSCMDEPDRSLAELFLEEMEGRMGFSERVPSENFQDAMAKDLMACAEVKEATVQTVKGGNKIPFLIKRLPIN